jgi:hypothetical protein
MSNKIETNVVKPEIKFFENETEFIILDSQWETQLDEKIVEIENYMKNNNGKGKNEEEKDELYKNAQTIWREYASTLTNTKYNFFLNRKQYKFLTDLILQKMEYDVNTVFFAIELTNLLGQMKEDSRYTNDEDLIGFPVDATEITYIYHLISKHKVKGLTNNSFLFAQVLRRIGDISKVFNYYDTAGKNLSTEIQNWVVTFEEGVSIETVETVEGEVV